MEEAVYNVVRWWGILENEKFSITKPVISRKPLHETAIWLKYDTWNVTAIWLKYDTWNVTVIWLKYDTWNHLSTFLHKVRLSTTYIGFYTIGIERF